MKILVVGAGGTGGYFGARLMAAGREVTFLVRAKRAALLARDGLRVRSRYGDLSLPAPRTVTAETLTQTFDLILLSCKAYDLDEAMSAIAPAVGPDTAILPVLNGMRHLERLDERFGGEHILGGLCLISSALGEDGRIRHFNDMHEIVLGERGGEHSDRIRAILDTLSGAGFDVRLSEAIIQEMWEKWTFLAALAGITCLMRATVGDVVASGSVSLATKLWEECAAIGSREGHPPRERAAQRARSVLTASGSALVASMLRDIEKGAPVEADHVLGDLLNRGGGAANSPLLQVAYAHLKAYEVRRARENRASDSNADG